MIFKEKIDEARFQLDYVKSKLDKVIEILGEHSVMGKELLKIKEEL